MGSKVAPQFVQNFASAGISFPHLGQYGILCYLLRGDSSCWLYQVTVDYSPTMAMDHQGLLTVSGAGWISLD